MLIFEDIDIVNPLIAEIIKLKNSIKCPICLEIVNNPVQISCKHIFCDECLNMFVSKIPNKLTCPVCKKNIKRQRGKPCENLEIVSRSVRAITEKLERQCMFKKGDLFKEKQVDIHKALRKESSNEVKKDAFDVLMGSSNNYILTRDKDVKTYSRKPNKKDKKVELYDKLINFEDNNCRLKIIEWLCDNHNKFDRLTQTQSILDDSESASSFDMPSISQEAELRNYSEKSKRAKSVRRTRSLDVKVRPSNYKLRSHSFSGDSQPEKENINIEEIESDKDPIIQDQVNILQILEEKCLNTIDTQLLIRDKANSKLEKNNRKRKRRKIINQKNTSKPNITGWTRMKQINKTLTESNREPRKLYASLSSSGKAKKKKVFKNTGQANLSKNPVVILNRLSAEVQLPEGIPETGIIKLDNLKQTSETRASDVHNNSIGKTITVVAEIHASNVEVQKDTSYNLYDVESYISSNIIKYNELQKDTSDKDKSKIESGNIFSSQNSTEEIDGIFSVATQIRTADSSVDSIEKKLMAIFSSQNTDKKVNTLKHNGGVNKMDEVFHLLDKLDKSLLSLEVTIKENDDIDIMKLSIEKLRLALLRDPLKENEVKNLFNITTQTVAFDLKSVAIQTEECESSGFKISSTADFRTLAHHTVGIQTDDVISDAPINIDSDSVSSRTSEVLMSNNDIINNLKQNYQFTESLDIINFDTQAVLNQNKKEKRKNNIISNDLKVSKFAKKKLDFDENMVPIQIIGDTDSSFDENSVVNVEGTIISVANDDDISTKLLSSRNNSKSRKPGSQVSNILFSLSKDCSNGNLMNQNESDNRFKRIRSLNDDSDSDNVTKKMRKQENPYVADNLSVEIDSQDSQDENESVVQITEKSSSSQARASMNYDEYLDRIMSKYTKNEEHSTTSTLNRLHISKQTRSQEVIDKCNALIKDANNSPLLRVHKHKITNDDYITNDIAEEFNLPFIDKKGTEKTTQSTKEHEHLRSKAYGDFSESTFCSGVMSTVEILAREFGEELEPLPDKSLTNYKHIGEVKVLQNVLLQKEEKDDEPSRLRYNLEEELQKMEEVTAASDGSEDVFSDSDIEIVNTTPQKPKSVKNTSLMSQSLHKRHSSNTCNFPLLLLPPEDSPDVICATDTRSYFDKTFAPPTAFQDATDDNTTKDNFNNIINTDQFDITLVASNMVNEDKDVIDLDVTLTEKTDTAHVNKKLTELKRLTGDNHKRTSLGLSSSLIPSEGALNVGNGDLKVPSPIDIRSISVNRRKMNNVNEQGSCSINTSKSINISPIEHNSRDLNPIERALRSNFSPLEITITKSQPKRVSALCTSTPKKQETILNYVNNKLKGNRKSQPEAISSTQLVKTQRSKPCIASTRISIDQQNSIYALTNAKLATYSSIFNSSVTHMIVLADERNCITDHTMKFVSAVASGIWVLRFEWILECLAKNEIVSEEPYEVLDVSGVAGPRIGRLTRSKGLLLRNFGIHVATPCLTLNKSDIENVIKELGGEIVPTVEMLQATRGIRLIITEAKTSQEYYMCEKWLQELKVVAVDIEWLSRSVGQYRLLSLRPYALCSDNALADLNYPEELLVDMPASSSQSIYCS